MKITQSGWELKVLATIAIIGALSFAQPVLFPLMMAFFLYLLFNPVLDWMLYLKIPRALAAAAIIAVLVGLVSWGISFLVEPATHWIDNAPANFKIVERKFSIIKKSMGKIIKAAETAQNIGEMTKDDKSITVATENSNIGSSLFSLTSSAVFLLSTILMFLFFLFIYFKTLLQNLDKIIYNRRKIKEVENEFILRLKYKVSRYMLVFTLISAGLGVVIAVVLWLLGLPNAILWGMMAMFLTFVPYIGHLMGIMIVFFVSVVTFDAYLNILAPPLAYFLIAVLEGQVVTPISLGNRLNLNPLVVFFSIFFWSWLWGVSGVIISVPFLITLKIVLEYLPDLAKYKSLLEQ